MRYLITIAYFLSLAALAQQATPASPPEVDRQNADTASQDTGEDSGETEELPDIRVLDQVGNATSLGGDVENLPTSASVRTAEQIDAQAVTNPVDLLRATTGVTVRNLGQGAIGEDVSIRGFSGGHGTDTAVFVDGIPINQPNGRTHGLSDIGWLIPEAIERIEVIKGPFAARYGNFARAGVINIITKDAATRSEVGAAGGSYGTKQASAAFGRDGPFAALDLYDRNGYRDNQFLRRYGAFGKYTFTLGNDASLAVQGFANRREFGAPGYLVLDDVRSGLVDRRSAFNDTDGGRAEVYGVSAHYNQFFADDSRLSAVAYLGYDDRSRFASFGSPDSQNVDLTEAVYTGWRVDWQQFLSDSLLLTIGSDGRYDDGERTRFSTDGNRQAEALVRDRVTRSLAAGIYAEAQWRPVDIFKATVGLRGDLLDADVNNRFDPAASGDGSTELLSPKVGLALLPAPWIEIYANRGTGFRSPSADELSPNNGQFNQLSAVELETYDAGINLYPGDGWSVFINAYTTDASGEINQIAPNEFANIGSTEREGFDVEVRYERGAWSAFASYSEVDARTTAGDLISNIPENQQLLGLTWRSNGWVADVFVQRYGNTPLSGDGSLSINNIYNVFGKLQYTYNRWRFFGQAVWHPNPLRSETAFNFGGQAGIDPKPRFEALVGFRYLL